MSPAVLHLRTSSGLHGPERHLIELGASLAEFGVRAQIALLARPASGRDAVAGVVAEAEARGVPARRLVVPERRIGAAVRSADALAREFDLLHSHDFKANLVALRIASRRRLPVFATCHLHTRESLRLRLHAAVDSWCLGRFDRVIAVAEALRADPALRRVAPQRLAIVANGLDPLPLARRAEKERAAAEEALGRRAGGPLLLAAGRLARQKGFDLLLTAFARLRREIPAGRLALAGEGPERPALARLASELGIAADLTWLGDRSDLAGLLAAADLVVVSSRREGLPYVALEALALGRPLVAAAAGGVGELVRDGEEGLLVPPEDPGALAAAMARSLGDPQAARLRGEAGRRRVREQFHSHRMAAATAALYRAAGP